MCFFLFGGGAERPGSNPKVHHTPMDSIGEVLLVPGIEGLLCVLRVLKDAQQVPVAEGVDGLQGLPSKNGEGGRGGGRFLKGTLFLGGV